MIKNTCFTWKTSDIHNKRIKNKWSYEINRRRYRFDNDIIGVEIYNTDRDGPPDCSNELTFGINKEVDKINYFEDCYDFYIKWY
ncbi:MAG TPA: hypothetical protein VI911_11790 [Patescibacteria group bacterium]|nr:hypothetical protein [Patescibacteria group bacterium]